MLTLSNLFEEGLNLARAGENERAARCFGRVLDLDPNNELAIYNLGVLMFRMDRWNDSADMFRRLMAYRPKDPDVFVNFGKILERGGRREQAMVCYKKALELDPDHSEALCRTGILLGKVHGRYEEAAEALRRSIELAGPIAEAHHGLAICCHHIGDIQCAVEHLKTALSLDPLNSAIHNHLGIMFMKIGEEQRAEELFRRALELNPNRQLKHQNLWEIDIK
jgi:Flp pilus assembly protein TadD